MPIPDQIKVHETLTAIEFKLAQIALLAFQGWLKCPDYLYSGNHPRIRANIMWGRMIHIAREFFDGTPGIEFFYHHNTVSIKVDGLSHAVLFRYKKADRTGKSRNIQTVLSDAYHDHSIRYLFDDMFDPDRIEVVYILNKFGSAIEDVRIVGRNGKHLAWWYSIMPEADILILSPPVTVKPSQKPLIEEELVRIPDAVLKKEDKKGE
jgi:hypothetical protein